MKSLVLALALLSTPAFADLAPQGAPEGADATFCLRFGPLGGCLEDGRGPVRPLPPPPVRPVQCIAENYRGMRFEGFGRFPREAQDNALANCYRAGSRECQIRFCR